MIKFCSLKKIFVKSVNEKKRKNANKFNFFTKNSVVSQQFDGFKKIKRGLDEE